MIAFISDVTGVLGQNDMVLPQQLTPMDTLGGVAGFPVVLQ